MGTPTTKAGGVKSVGSTIPARTAPASDCPSDKELEEKEILKKGTSGF